MKSIKPLSGVLAILFLIFFSLDLSGQKKVIESVDDIPRFTYTVEQLASEIYSDDAQFEALYQEIKKNQQMLLDDYIIKDATLMKGVLNTLKQISFFEGNFDDVGDKVELIRALQEKPSDKLLSGTTNMAFLKALESGNLRRLRSIRPLPKIYTIF